MEQRRATAAAAEDRAVGALVGLAVGDALGASLEFQPRKRGAPHRELTGGGVFDLPPGAWTDDTSMALCLADSLLACGGLNATDLMQRFVRWWREGENSATGVCFDMGATTRRELARFVWTGDPDAACSFASCAGAGSLMRLAPAVLFGLPDRQRAASLAAEQSRCTHAAPECLDACAYVGLLLTDAIAGVAAEAVLCPRVFGSTPVVGRLASGERPRSRTQVRSTGYVMHVLEAALWAVSGASSFEAALVRAVNLGGDADTIGAVTGQLAGALRGYSAIPPRWLERLHWREHIEARAQALWSFGR
jgi:ADP-ribosyl-[dinitrogen reductase] hydrolase